MSPVWQLGEVSWSMVCAVCCHMAQVFAVMHLYNIFYIFYCFCPFLFLYFFFFKSGIDKSTEWSPIPACPSFVCLFNRGVTEGTNCPNFVFDVCVCFVLCKFVYRTDFLVFE